MKVLAIDVGTTGVRGAVVDASGRGIAERSVARPYSAPRAGWAEADADAWWSAACEIARALPVGDVAAVAVTGQAPTAVLLGDDERPLRPAILWLDTRAELEARAIGDALGDEAFALGGNAMHAYYLGAKLAWVVAHEPEVARRTKRVVQPHAYVALRLTGEAAIDYSTAALASPLYDARARAWSERACDAVGVPIGWLPPVVPAHRVIGQVTSSAASVTGLRAGTPVVAGGGDFAASALGAGVVDEGQACLMLGTAGNLLMPMDAPRFDARLINSHHVGADRFLALGGTLCGAVIEWTKGLVAPNVDFAALDAEAAAIDVGSEGLLMLPYLQGERTPIWDERARGVFFGLQLSHGRAHLYRAALEAIALSFRHCAAVAAERGIVLREVVAANGAGKSALFRQILCDALGAPLAYAPAGATGGTIAGAAVLALLGAGAITAPDAARAWISAAVRHEPRPDAHARYESLFARRLALYESVRDAFDEKRGAKS